MDQPSPLVGEIVGDDDDNRTAEEFLSLMTNDPTLAANTVSDVLEAAASAFADQNSEFYSNIITDIVNELDPGTRAFLEALTDATRRRQIFQERLPFIDWVAANQSSGVDRLSAKLLDAADRTDWPEPTTYANYREYLTELLASGTITTEDLEYFQTVLWPEYMAVCIATVGSEYRTTKEWQYSVEMYWEGPDSTNTDLLSIIEIDIARDSLRTMLQQFRGSQSEGIILYRSSDGTVVAGVPSEPPREDMQRIVRAVGPSGRGYLSPSVLGGRHLIINAVSRTLAMGLCLYVPEGDVLQDIRVFRLWFIAFLGLSVMLIVAYSATTFKLIHEPIQTMMRAFRDLERGDFSRSIEHRQSDEFHYLFAAFNNMTTRLRDLIDQSYKQRILVQKAELRQLHSQINPHFLYNTFFMLYSIAKAEGSEATAELTRRLGTYYQFITRTSTDEVALSQEIQHARMYAEIQQMRYSNRIAIVFEELPAAFAPLQVPRLIVQPILENAIDHGFRDMLRAARLTVGFACEEMTLLISVSDNGGGLDDAGLTELRSLITSARDEWGDTGHTALVNIHKRLQLKFGPDSGISLERNADGGLTVCLRITLPGGRDPCTGF